MSDPTPLDVEAIRARLDAVTPGPWKAYDSNEGTEYFPMWSVANDDYHNPREDGVAFGASIECGEKADAELIANAPTDLRRLLDENARLDAENDDMRKRVAFAAAVVSGDAAEMLAESLEKVRAELAARDRTVEALSERLAAKNAELDQCIREAAADKAKLAAVLAAAESWDLTDEQIERMTSNIYPVDRAVQWLKLTTMRACTQDVKAALDAAPEMPRPPAVEALGAVEPSGTGSGRGTGVLEAPETTQASAPWIPSFYGSECPHRPEWTCPEHGECRACECDCNTYVADLEESDLTLIPGDMVVRDPQICSGRPTMRGTRILASRIAGELAAGTSWETLREWYPSLPSLPVSKENDR